MDNHVKELNDIAEKAGLDINNEFISLEDFTGRIKELSVKAETSYYPPEMSETETEKYLKDIINVATQAIEFNKRFGF